LDLKRGLPTVGLFVKDDGTVRKGEELTMDWGCWKEISECLLPGQALLSVLAHKKEEELVEMCQKESVPIPTRDSILVELEQLEPRFFTSSDVDGSQLDAAELSGVRYDILHSILFPDSVEHAPSTMKRHKKTSHKELSKGAVDYSTLPACVAVLPEGKMKNALSRGARRHLSRLEQAGTSDRNVGPLFDGEELSERVRVVEIVDERNPSKLLALPGQIPRGVVANRNFKTDDAVLCEDI
jgi:hypothetical protein